MAKVGFILGEMMYLIRKHKLFFLAPVLLVLSLLAILVFTIGPAAIISFLYAGV